MKQQKSKGQKFSEGSVMQEDNSGDLFLSLAYTYQQQHKYAYNWQHAEVINNYYVIMLLLVT